MRKRTFLAAGVAVGAAGAGLFASHWRDQQAAQEAHDRAAEDAFWALRLKQPDDSELVLSTFRGQPLLLNFWATWCPPCVKEMPLLNSFYQEHRATGWRVLGLAVDRLAPVRSFLQRLPMSFPIGMVESEGIALAQSLGNPKGQLPFTVVFDRRGHIQHRRLGIVEPDHLTQWTRG